MLLPLRKSYFKGLLSLFLYFSANTYSSAPTAMSFFLCSIIKLVADSPR